MIEDPLPPASPQMLAPSKNFGVRAELLEESISSYDDDQKDVIRYWFFLGKDRGWSDRKLSEATGVSASTLSRVFRGVYGAGLTSVVASLAKAREDFAEVSRNPEFIRTSLSVRLFAAFDKTRALGNVTICWGPMGIGKTTVIEEYKRHNPHGKTQVVRFPAGATFAYFVVHVAHSLGISLSNVFQTRQKIIAVMGAGKRLLIVDELHQAFLTTRSDTAVKCCEFLREIADVSGCGIVLIGTEVLRKEIFNGPNREALAQLVDRGTVQLSLPPKATKGDLSQFLTFYGLKFPGDSEPEARQILSDILASSGLRKLTLHLRDGSSYAARKGEDYTWDHFIAAFEAIQSLAR